MYDRDDTPGGDSRARLFARAAGLLRGRPRAALAVGAAVIVAFAAGFLLLGRGPAVVPGAGGDGLGGDFVATDLGPAVRLRRVDVVLSFRRGGRLEPLEDKPITNRWSGYIKTIWPDGGDVKAGDVVLELDTRDIDEQVANREAEIVVRKAQLVQTEKTQAKAIKSAELALRQAELELEWQKLNERAVLAGAATEDLARAEAELRTRSLVVRNREEEVRILGDLAAKGFATSTELEQKRLQHTEARLELEKARITRDELVAGATEFERKEAALEVKIAEYSLDSASKALDSARAVAAGAVAHAERLVKRHETQLERDREAREKHVSLSPADGYILHTPPHWLPEWTPGQRIWRGMKIMSVPSKGKLKVETKVTQSDVDRVQVGTRCRVTVPARPGRPCAGEVVNVSRQGEDEFASLDEATREKVGEAGRQAFEVEVKLLDVDLDLKPGFRAEVEFLLEEMENALVLPWGAVSRRDAGATVTVVDDGRAVQREVELGFSNEHTVVIEKGCKEGDVVLLARGGG